MGDKLKVYVVMESNGYEPFMDEYDVDIVKIFKYADKAFAFANEGKNRWVDEYDVE